MNTQITGGFMKSLMILALMFATTPAQAFDLEDYATTYRATRDAYLKALNEYGIASRVMATNITLTGQLTPHNADTVRAADGLNSCSGIKESKDLRSKAKVIPEFTDLLKDPRVLKVQAAQGTQQQLDDLVADMNSYYDQFSTSAFDDITVLNTNPSFTSDVMWMYKTQFDLEDYATTYRATRDAFLKSLNELTLATGPYDAAKAAYAVAVRDYYNYDGCADAGMDDSMEEVLATIEL